jgi:hypothetical protein
MHRGRLCYASGMARSLRLFVLLLAVWQSIGVLASPLSPLSGTAAGHVGLHWIGDAHHHHDDGSVHHEPSPDSQAHVAQDCAGNPAAPTADSRLHAWSRSSSAVIPSRGIAWMAPPIEAPFRPPRA